MNRTKRPYAHNSVSLVIVLTLVGSLAACSDSESSSETTVTTAPTTTEAVPTTASVAPETTTPATSAPTTTAVPAVVTIDPDGIGEGKLGAWCEIDHLIPDTNGGPTNLDNLAMWCTHHHHEKHRPGVRVHGNTHNLRIELANSTMIDCPVPQQERRTSAAA